MIEFRGDVNKGHLPASSFSQTDLLRALVTGFPRLRKKLRNLVQLRRDRAANYRTFHRMMATLIVVLVIAQAVFSLLYLASRVSK